MSAPKILIIFAHPALEKSRVHYGLANALLPRRLVTWHDLYETYPDFDIDINREQKLLLKHDLIIFQHPFYWYSMPGLLKDYFDLVLEHGWAYGTGGDRLKGKKWMHIISTGGPKESYARKGFNRFTMRQFLTPLDQTANLCGCTFLPPYVIHGAHTLNLEDIDEIALDYQQFIQALKENQIKLRGMRPSSVFYPGNWQKQLKKRRSSTRTTGSAGSRTAQKATKSRQNRVKTPKKAVKT